MDITNKTSASDAKLILTCTKCDKELTKKDYLVNVDWICEEHGKIYGFYSGKMFDYQVV